MLLLISGGHSQFLNVKNLGKYKRLGTTIDDALGEAFDKTAKLLGLNYPGGVEIENCAKYGDENSYSLPKPMFDTKDFNYSFIRVLSIEDGAATLTEFSAQIIKEIIEVKPKAQTKKPTKKGKHYGKYLREARTYATNRAKWEAAEEYCLDRGYKFRIITEDHLKA